MWAVPRNGVLAAVNWGAGNGVGGGYGVELRCAPTELRQGEHQRPVPVHSVRQYVGNA